MASSLLEKHIAARPAIGRRQFLAAAMTPLAAQLSPTARGGRTRLVLLGTGGGPRPRKSSSASAQVIIANNAAYVIDCGDGVARQMPGCSSR